jgi:hypothetical protein
MAQAQWDSAYDLALNAPIMLQKFASIEGTKTIQASWLAADTTIKQIGGGHRHTHGITNMWPLLDSRDLQRVCKTWGINWHNVQSWIDDGPQNEKLAWTYDDDEGNSAWSLQTDSVVVRAAFF